MKEHIAWVTFWDDGAAMVFPVEKFRERPETHAVKCRIVELEERPKPGKKTRKETGGCEEVKHG